MDVSPELKIHDPIILMMTSFSEGPSVSRGERRENVPTWIGS